MKEPKGVHVRRLDGEEDIYENVSLGKDRGYDVLHDYAITAKGFLIVTKLERDGAGGVDAGPIREAVYAPGCWVSVRSEVRTLMFEEPGHGPGLDV